MRIVSVERLIFRFKYSTGRTKCNSITISLRLLRLFICFYLLFPHLPFRTQIMKLRTQDSRMAVLLNQSLWTTIRYNLYHPVINNTYYFLLAALPLQQNGAVAGDWFWD